jgi:hypothetical protein
MPGWARALRVMRPLAPLEAYARQAHNVEAERQACEIRLRAEKKEGRLTKKLGKARGKRTDRPTSPREGEKSTKEDQLNHDVVDEMIRIVETGKVRVEPPQIAPAKTGAA